MLGTIRELIKQRELLWMLIRRDLALRYKGSFMGVFWSLLNPLLNILVLVFVAKVVLGMQVSSMTAYLAAAYLPFTFFNQSVMDSAQSVLSNINILKKVYLAREMFTVAIVCSNFIHLLISLGVMLVWMLCFWHFAGPSPFSAHFYLLPWLLAILFVLTMGLSLMFAALNVFYEDVKYILSILLWVFFFANPIFYLQEQVYYRFLSLGPNGALYYKLWNLNPVAVVCANFRVAMVAPTTAPVIKDGVPTDVPMFGPAWPHLVYATVFSAVVLWVGHAVFERFKWRFVERP